MEMLIVVAIIAVLVAVAIPTFSSQLHKARVATDWANVRSYYAQLQYEFMETGEINNAYLHELGMHSTCCRIYNCSPCVIFKWIILFST